MMLVSEGVCVLDMEKGLYRTSKGFRGGGEKCHIKRFIKPKKLLLPTN